MSALSALVCAALFRSRPMKTMSRFAAAGACALALLTGCGGGTGQIEPYQPGKLLVFGDEHSVLTAEGRKYAVNALNTAGTIDCDLNPLWIQTVANGLGFRFAQCLGTATQALATTYAAPGANVAAVTRQIDAVAGAIAPKDLVLLMAGLHDVIEIYQSRAAGERDEDLLERARVRGIAMANQVNRLIGLDARVVVATIPDVGLTPWALTQGAAQAKLLSQLSLAFNGRLRATMLQDGRFVGLVLADELTQSAASVPAAYGLLNWTEAVCLGTVNLPNCTNSPTSLVTSASELTYLWADGRFFGTTIHQQVGATALSRVAGNRF
jgi:outer membrane lipase/esterase